MNYTKYLDVALDAVKKAEKIVSKYYYADQYDVRDKADSSPVTIADREAQAIIIETICSRFPDHQFLGEEDSVDGKGEYVWVIDPIDGTKNFIRKIPFIATLLALQHNREFVLGVSNMPLMGELLYAGKEQGAYCNGSPIHVSEVNCLEDAYMSYGSIIRFKNEGLLGQFQALDQSIRWSRGIGDAYSYHLLAQGKIDIMIEASTNIWDIAPFKVIVEEAGGKMTDIAGKSMDERAGSALATNGKIHEKVLEKLTAI